VPGTIAVHLGSIHKDEVLDCVVEQARHSILQGKANAFDQQRINSLFPF